MSPTLKEAYNSLSYFGIEVPFGWLIHGLHYWGAQAMVILVLLHMSQVYLWGAYKRPHELQWLIGVGLLIFTMAMILTGGVLPWDKQSYWVVVVADEHRGDRPADRRLHQTVDARRPHSRPAYDRPFFHPAYDFFARLHSDPYGRSPGRPQGCRSRRSLRLPKSRTERSLLARTRSSGTGSSAVSFSSSSSSCPPGPEPPSRGWPIRSTAVTPPSRNGFFFSFYQVLKYFPGSLEFLATVGIPLLGTLLLVSIPFFDRNPERRPSRRPFAVAGLSSSWGVLSP